MNEKKYDIFLAYYGSSNKGSEQAARLLFHKLSSAHIPGKPLLRIYFHPETDPQGVFKETPRIVARTPMFLMVIDKNVPRDSDGLLPKYREDGALRNLYEEVRSFHNSKMFNDHAAKLYIADDFDFRQAEQLDPIFGGKTALRNLSDVVSWISEFFTNIYPDRLYRAWLDMAKNDRFEFNRGTWCAEAETCWKSSHYEPLGRLLLAYYAASAQAGRLPNARAKGQKLYEELQAAPALQPETRVLLAHVEIKRALFY